MRLMIVSCSCYGKLRITNRVFVPHSLTRLTKTTGLSKPLLLSQPSALRDTPMPTMGPAAGEMPAILPTPMNLFEKTPQVKSSPPLSLSPSILLKDIAVMTKEGLVCHSKIPELALLELAFELFSSVVSSVSEIQKELSLRGLCPQILYNLTGKIYLSCQ